MFLKSDYEPTRLALYDTPAADMQRPLDRFAYWINERSRIQILRRRTLTPPWTQDPILQRFKFCNVHREHDRVTTWVRKNWRDTHYDDPMAWFSMGVARLINWPDSLAELGYPVPWDPEHVRAVLQRRKASGAQVFTGAYMITNAGMKASKVDTVVHLLSNLHRLQEPPVLGDTLQAAHAKLRAADCAGMGSFIAAQVVADAKHMLLLRTAPDWWDWAAPGPGSARGLQRLTGQPVNPRHADAFVATLIELRRRVGQYLQPHVERLCLQDIQNCLCEFDKYERTLWGEGTPRSRYPGA